MSRYWAASLFFAYSLTTAASSLLPDSSAHRHYTMDTTTHKSVDSSLNTVNRRVPRTPIHYHWPVDSSQTVCREPLETPAECWRQSPQWAIQEIGFPGARSRTISLSSFEPVSIKPFYQPALSASPYGIGGYTPFDRVEESEQLSEVWSPVVPLDTPVTSLHWMRGALQLNQFTLDLRRMVGDKTYLGLQIHSDRADSQFYEYSFNIDQPYLSGWGIPALKRDSASLVLSDTSHSIRSFQLRPRVGYWIDSQTVLEAYADIFENSTSMANPTHPGRNDSTQLLYPASFSDNAYGLVAARSTENLNSRFMASYSEWIRGLSQRGDSALRFSEHASGTLANADVEETFLNLPGHPRVQGNIQSADQTNAFWLHGDKDAAPALNAGTLSGAANLKVRPAYGPIRLDFDLASQLRKRPDALKEFYGGAAGGAKISLPWNFDVNGTAGWKKEGASEDNLFRWQPALGFYPNPNLKPRTDLHVEAGGSWESRWIGFGASWERHQYGNNWLPRVLPEANICDHVDSARYPLEQRPLCSDADNILVPDSIALALVNYHQEIRDMLHYSLFLRAGNWKLSLLNSFLIKNKVQDDNRLGFEELNRQIPNRIFKGQLFWRRKIIGGRLGLQTQWDWEWTSTRYVYASDMNGFSRAVKLDEYLALDFTARMEIKTFMLHFRAMNLNHDRYATEPGVHPPGVNFRFGVDWDLFN